MCVVSRYSAISVANPVMASRQFGGHIGVGLGVDLDGDEFIDGVVADDVVRGRVAADSVRDRVGCRRRGAGVFLRLDDQVRSVGRVRADHLRDFAQHAGGQGQ